MSDASSAGIARGIRGYGTTCRKDVLRGVDIPVLPGAAGRARPLPGGQTQLGEQAPARRARLRAGIGAVDHDQLAAVPLALERQLAAELTPAAVRDRAGQMPVAEHAADIEVFDHNEIGRAHPGGAGPVQQNPPRVEDLAVGAGDLGRGLDPVRRPFLAAGQAPLAAGQAPLAAGQAAGLALQVRGLAISCPSLVTAKFVTPRSTPTACPVSGRGTAAATWTVKVTYQIQRGFGIQVVYLVVFLAAWANFSTKDITA